MRIRAAVITRPERWEEMEPAQGALDYATIFGVYSGDAKCIAWTQYCFPAAGAGAEAVGYRPSAIGCGGDAWDTGRWGLSAL